MADETIEGGPVNDGPMPLVRRDQRGRLLPGGANLNPGGRTGGSDLQRWREALRAALTETHTVERVAEVLNKLYELGRAGNVKAAVAWLSFAKIDEQRPAGVNSAELLRVILDRHE